MTETRDKQAEATRTEILDQAHSLFAHYGFSKTNIGDIAKGCGMSPGNLYRYFKNKQAIGLAAVQQYFGTSEQAMQAALSAHGGTPEERMRRLLTTGVSHIVAELRANPKIVELAEFICEDEQGLEVLSAHIGWKRARLVEELHAGIAAGDFQPCDAEETAATILLALKVFWMPMTLANWRDPDTILPELEAVIDLLFRGLRA